MTNFKFKHALYKIVLPFFQLFDTGRMHPVRERALRALHNSVDYIEKNMTNAVGFETQKELMTYCLNEVKVTGYYLEFGVFTGGTLRFMAKSNPSIHFHGFDSFEGLPDHWSGMPLPKNSFNLKGNLPKVPRM